MKFAIFAPLLLALGACSGPANETIEREGEAPVTMIDDDDREMIDAMAKARATLGEFERRLAEPPAAQTMIIIKGRFEDGDEVEHMWIDQISVTAEGYRGVLGNEPMKLTNVKAGDTVLVARHDVSDWVAVDDGRLVGGYTMRVIRARLPAEERANFDAQNGFRVED